MKKRIYTLTTLCLFFMLKINAQSVDPVLSVGNQIDLTLLVKDGLSGQQVFNLLAEDDHNVFHQQDFIIYNINLNYQSEQDVISYFRLRCEFEIISSVDPITPDDYPFLGATAPVIIPPVRKKKKIVRIPRPLGTYPFLAKIPYRIHPRKYKVTIELLKYESFEDYIEGNDQFIVSTSKVIYLNATHNMPSGRSGAMTASPNPSTNHLIIEHTNNTLSNTPLKVIIYNDKGVKISQHTLTNTRNSSYNLDTSHLQEGRYYFQLSHGGKTQVKTIIKQ